jgi:hypothetical protein
MRIKDLILENTPIAPAGQAPGQTSGEEGQDIGKLTASISSLQKQIADLQKAALQQTSQAVVKPAATPAPGEAGQAQAPKGTIAPAVQSQQPAQQTQQQAPGQKPPLGQPNGVPMGQEPAKTSQASPVAAGATPAPGVSQSPSITNMKIKQSMLQNQSGGTK